MPHVKSENGWLSVTEVLSLTIDKPFLRYWFGKYGTEKCGQIQRESQEIGTEVHRMIEERFKFGASTVTLGSNGYRMVTNFWSKFVEPYEVKPLKLELTMQDSKLKLQGTMDAMVDSNHGIRIMDWKTSSQIDKISVPLQLSAYNYLFKGKGVIGGGVVRIDKESDKVEVKWYDNLDQYWSIFRSALKLARFIKYGEI